MDDLNFIKKFTKIHITNICKRLNICYDNLIKGRTTKEKIHKVKLELEKEIKELERG